MFYDQALPAASIVKKALAFLLFVLFCCTLWPSQPVLALAASDLTSSAAVLMDADTGQVLFQKNMHERHRPASITKIMTCLLALEKGDLTDTITMSYDAVFDVPRDSSHVALDVDEELSLKDALYAMMLESANEAANGIAEYISGTMTDFAQLMTERAKEAGALDTNFVTTNGLDDDNHYTTPYDMAMITREAIKEPEFFTFAGETRYDMEPTNKQKLVRNFNNKNKMIYENSPYYYEGILGGKTGYTSLAKNTLVEIVRREDRTLIAVLMEAEGADSTFEDAALLFDYGFDNFLPYSLNNPDYQETYGLLLHKDIPAEEVELTYGIPTTRSDGSTLVEVTAKIPASFSSLMYPEMGIYTLTSASQGEKGLTSAGASILSGQDGESQGLAGKVLGFLRFVLKLLVYLFAALVLAACFFRTRRYFRRKKRAEARRRRIEQERQQKSQSYYAQGFGPRPGYGGVRGQQSLRQQSLSRDHRPNRQSYPVKKSDHNF